MKPAPKSLILMLSVATLLSLLVSCAAPATPQVVEKPVEVTRVVEKSVQVTQVVEKQVTQVVEKQVTQVVEKAAARAGELVLAMNNECDTLDPHVSSSRYDWQIENPVYERLVAVDPKDGSYQPYLATSWQGSSDGLVWTFKLRNDVKFQDGTPFNAAAVKINLERILDPATKSEGAIYQLGPLKKVDVVDDYTVKLTYDKPYGKILSGLSDYTVAMISPAAIKQYGQQLYEHMVGTGPYKFVDWVKRDHVTLERWADYNWAPKTKTHTGPGYLTKITFKFIKEGGTRLATLQTGEANIIMDVPPDSFTKLADRPDIKTSRSAVWGYPPSLNINVKKFPTDDLKVRQALNYFIDQQEISQAVFAGTFATSNAMLAPNTWGYEPKTESVYKFDPKKGTDLLTQAGWKKAADGSWEKDGKKLELTYLTLPGSTEDVGTVIQAQLKDQGIPVKITVEDNPAQQSDAQKGTFHLVWLNWGLQDPSVLHQMFGCENDVTGWNFSHYCDQAAQKLMEDGEKETDIAKRQQIYSDLQMKLRQDAVTVPLYLRTRLWGMKSNVMGLVVEGGEWLSFYDMYVSQG